MKRLVVCADGTWNEPLQTCDHQPCPTHVVKFYQAILPMDAAGTRQVSFYQKGVGERGGLWDHLTGGAFGLGISKNIEELYQSLIHYYEPGDELWLIGFSRGAYTVRSLAALIRNCGILRPENGQRWEEAYAFYRDRSDSTHPSSANAKAFRATYAWPDFEVRFIGVWDTVGALGVPVTPLRFWTKSFYEFHDMELTSHVDYAFQALAIDERRKPFQPSIWVKQPDSPASQVLEQAWFPGVHADVGGGYSDGNLASGALRWMWDRAERVGLALDGARRPEPDPSAPMHDSLNLFYRTLGDGSRAPGQTGDAAFEAISQQAVLRMQADSTYRPANLKPFLAKPAPVSIP